MLGSEPHHNNEYALIIAIHRDELVQAGLPEQLKNTIDDDTLMKIANELKNAIYQKSDYWEYLNEIIDEMGLKNKPDNKDVSIYVGDDDDGYC